MPKASRFFAARTLALVLACLILTATAALADAPQKLRIVKVTEVGSKVFLNDGSEWSIPNYDDQQVVYNWLPTQEVQIREGSLVNMLTGDIIDAKQLTKKQYAPQPPPPSPFSSAKAAPPPAPAPAPAPQASAQPSASTMAALSGLEAKLQRLDNKLEDLVVRLQALELRLVRLERMAGVLQ